MGNEKQDKGVVPTNFCEEITPPPRETPYDWIVRRDGAFFFATPEGFYADEESYDVRLVDGGIYDFMRLETYGEATLSIAEDGGFSVDREMPPEAESVFITCDPDTLSSSLKELVENCRDSLGVGEHIVEYFTWNDERWRFNATTKSFDRVSNGAAQCLT